MSTVLSHLEDGVLTLTLNRPEALNALNLAMIEDLRAATARAEHDEALIDRLWSPHIAAWYDDGRDDRDLAVLRLDIDQCEIWNAATSPLTMVNRPAAAKAQDARQGHHAIVSSR